MRHIEDPVNLSPEEFELAVKGILDAGAGQLVNYESQHLHELCAADGEYTIDVSARFEALGANFLVLVECKHHKRKIERQDVQVLHSKLQSLGAQKAMLFSTSGFQAGAIEFADSHGIALVHIVDGSSCWVTRSADQPTSAPPWLDLPADIGWWCSGASRSVMS